MLKQKINSQLLNKLLQRMDISIAEFARQNDIPVQDLYNYKFGMTTPPVAVMEVIAEQLNVPLNTFYLHGSDLTQMGIEAALMDWTLDQLTQRQEVTASDAVQLLKHNDPNSEIEAADHETRTDKVRVQTD